MPYVEWSTDDRVFAPAEVLQVSLGYKDLYLDYFMNKQSWIEQIQSGQVLVLRMPDLLLPHTNDRLVSVGRLSKETQTAINRVLAKDYILSEASVQVMVYWRKQDTTQDTLIFLPDLVFKRKTEAQ